MKPYLCVSLPEHRQDLTESWFARLYNLHHEVVGVLQLKFFLALPPLPRDHKCKGEDTIMKASKIVWTGRVISGLVGAFFIFNVLVKLFPATFYPEMAEGMAKMGIPMELLTTIAALELLCAVLYLIPPTAVLGSVMFTGYLGGAMLTHLRVGEGVLVHIILAGVIWLGIYLREPRLHKLLPLRR